jgi:hypothetical protein
MRVDPIGVWPGTLTRDRRRSNFASPMTATLDLLDRELFMLQAKDARLQVAIPASQFRLDGFPRSTAKAEHPGIILTMNTNVGALSYPCDTFTAWEDNLRAIALALEALRKVDRYGVTKRGEQYRGFLAIEATAMPAGFATADEAIAFLADIVRDEWRDGRVDTSPGNTRALLRGAQRRTHPDAGGDAATFQRVSAAESTLREAGLL